MKDYYKILGVTRNSDNGTIKEAYRRKALQYHPDKNKAPNASSKFQLISEAYSILGNPYKRGRYDVELEQQSYQPENNFNMSMNNAFNMFDQLFSNTSIFTNSQPRGIKRQFSFQEPSIFDNDTNATNTNYYSYSSHSSSIYANGKGHVSQSYIVNNNGQKNHYQTKYDIDSSGRKTNIQEKGNKKTLFNKKYNNYLDM